MFTLLLTSLSLFTIRVALWWAPTGQASASSATAYSSLSGWLITVETDRTYYYVGDTVYISGRLTYGGWPQAHVCVSIGVESLESNTSYYVGSATTDEEGKYKSNFTLGINTEPGEYIVFASTSQCTSQTSFQVVSDVNTLTISTVGNGFVTLNATGTYHYGDVVQLTAVPATGWSFKCWSGDLTGSANPATLLMTGNFSVTVNFALPRLFLDPSLVNRTYHDVGRYFNVSVKIEGITDLFGFDLNVTWDNTLMTLNHSCYDDSLDALWGAGKWYVAVDEGGAGWLKLVAVSTKDSFNTTGEQTMFILEFRVEDPHTNTTKQTSIHCYTQKLSDSQYSAIAHTMEDGIYGIAGGRPELAMNPTSKKNRMYGETFTVEIDMSDAFDVTDFEFEIHYNTILLDYGGITWNALGSGTINVDEAEGNITGSTSGTPISGRQTLITVEFKTAYYHVWKNDPGWTNDLTDIVFFQWANLSFPSDPDLRYERGGLDQINVGPDFAYTFSPIQGDVNNDGTVDIFDLRTVGAYYLVRQGDPNWTEASTYDLRGDGIVDIFDLTTAAANFGYTYIP